MSEEDAKGLEGEVQQPAQQEIQPIATSENLETLQNVVLTHPDSNVPITMETSASTETMSKTADEPNIIEQNTETQDKPISQEAVEENIPMSQNTSDEDLDDSMTSLPELVVVVPPAEAPVEGQKVLDDVNMEESSPDGSDKNLEAKGRPNSVDICDKELQEVQAVSQEMKAQQTSSCSSEPESSVYHLKWFDWKGEQTPIVTQNENGPCPLLAIGNVLILARKITLPKMQQFISAKQLMEYIGDCILSEAPKQEGNEELILNYQQNMQDAIDIMYKLQTGIDVNVKFSGVAEFEFTPECIVFDLLKIVLYHGWLVDPQDETTLNLVQGLSYNQLVEKMLLSKDGEGDTVVEGLVIEEFLSRTASQLTYHGLCELNETIEDEELCVFFRNNHFSTLYKHKGELFILVTDQGFLTEPAVSWETLINIEGDGQFVNSQFKTVTLQNSGFTSPTKNTTKVSPNTPDASTGQIDHENVNMSQEDRDYLIALSLQDEDENGVQANQPKNTTTTQTVDNDHAFALQLQEEEDRLARQQQQQQRQQPQPQHRQPRPQHRQPQPQLQRDAPRSEPRTNNQARPQQQHEQSRDQSPEKSKCSIS